MIKKNKKQIEKDDGLGPDIVFTKDMFKKFKE